MVMKYKAVAHKCIAHVDFFSFLDSWIYENLAMGSHSVIGKRSSLWCSMVVKYGWLLHYAYKHGLESTNGEAAATYGADVEQLLGKEFLDEAALLWMNSDVDCMMNFGADVSFKYEYIRRRKL
ncbi:hypothetical protein Dimus_007679 [Dionaea muscipula]